LQQRRRRRRQPDRTGFLGLRQRRHDIGFMGDGRAGARGDGDERHGEAAGIGENGAQFRRLPEFEIITTTSSPVIMPRSPWLASAG
jgi:hypothetical protein